MAKTITRYGVPGDGLPYRIMPVANGLIYSVKASENTRDGFLYTAEIFVNDVSVAKLRHNRDVTADNQGIFDVSRVVENFIKTDTTFLQADGTQRLSPINYLGQSNAQKKVNVKFGAQYDRTLKFSSASNLGGYTFLNFQGGSTITDVTALQFINIITSNNTTLIGAQLIKSITSLGIELYVPWNANYASFKGVAYEANYFYDNYGWTDPVTNIFMIGFIVRKDFNPNYKVGDTLIVQQGGSPTFLAYNGEAKCMGTADVNVGGVDYLLIKTNKAFLGSTPAEFGMIYTTDKYTYEDPTLSADVYAFDGAVSYLNYNSWTSLTYSMNNTNLGKFLTNKSLRTADVFPTDNSFLLSLFGSTPIGSTFTKILVKAYNQSGLLTNIYINVTNTSLRGEINISPQLIGALSGTFLTALNNQTLTYYTIQMVNSSNTVVSETFIINIDYNCVRYTPYTFKFKNRLGGWDFFNFTARSDKKINVTRNNINKKLNSYKSSPNRYKYYVGDRGMMTYNVAANESYIVNSGFLSDDEAKWLEELFTSPDVYWIKDNQEIPIMLTETDYNIGTKENRGQINYVVEFRPAYNINIQRR